MTLVIMAAGMGSRFGGLKQIEPVGPNGEFIIDYSIYDAKRCGFDKIVFIIKEENYEIFKETIGKRVEGKITVEYVFQNNLNVPIEIPTERVKPLGTAHAILCCKDLVKENFAVINADDFYGYNAYKVLAEYLKKTKDEFLMVSYLLGQTLTKSGKVKRGVCHKDGEYLTDITESEVIEENNKLVGTELETGKEINVDKNTLVSMNMFGFTPKIFELLENNFKEFLLTHDIMKSEYLIPSELSKYIKEGLIKLRVLETDAKWFGITYKEDKEEFTEEINKLVKKVYIHQNYGKNTPFFIWLTSEGVVSY